jgi:hypothetical protein
MHSKLPILALRTAAVLLASSSFAFAQWLQKTPATSPTARSGAAVAFDTNSLGVVLFGGGAPFINNETWVYDGINWTQQTPATSPTARFGAQLVHDSTRGVSVLYGGLASSISIPPPNSDTWEWSGTAWTQITTTANAGPRYQYGACFDSVRSRTVIYGGANSQLLGTPNNQTWEYQGTTWTQIATVGNPGPRNRPAVCFHAGLGRTVLFGGYDGNNLTNSTWLYDGTTWTQVAVVGSLPPARSSASMAYDPVRNVCVMMGGQDLAGPLADTWTFDGSAWQQQQVTTQAVRDHSLAFLPLTNQVVKFGGFAAAPNTLSNQTWELAGGSYGRGCVGTNGVPALSAVAAARLGQNYTLNLSNLNPTFNLAFLVFGLGQLPGVDLTTLLNMPGCAAFATADVLLSITGTVGNANFTWSPVSGPLGASLYCQALCFDPTVNAFGFTVSNAVFATLNN